MDILLGWLTDKVLAWRSLHPVLRYLVVGLVFALGLGLACIEWMGHLAQREPWYRTMIRDAVH